MAVTLRYFTEFGKHVLQKTIRGGIYARVYCILLRVQCRRKVSSRSLSHLLMSFLSLKRTEYWSNFKGRVRVTVAESCWRNFLMRTGLVQHWTNFCGRLTQLQGLQTGSSWERTVCTRDMQMSVQMVTTLSTNCNWWRCVRTGKATFPYWKLLFLSSIFSERELKFMFAICHRPSVCLSSVCLSSVTFVRPTQTIEIFGNFSTP